MDEEREITYAEAKEQILKWLPYSGGGNFGARDVWAQFSVFSAKDKHNVTQVLSNLKAEGILEGDKGRYRYINRELKPLDWVNADPGNIFEVTWPYGWGDKTTFGFTDNIALFPNNVVMVSGVTNKGKSAFLLNTLILNMDDHKCRYLTNEMGAEELQKRLNAFSSHYELTDEYGEPKFEAAERYGDYEDVVLPGGITFIDYLEPGENPYLIGVTLEAIKRNLCGGVAFVALQKNPGSYFGVGGHYSEDLARVVLHIENDYMLVKKAKDCRIENVEGKKFSFEIRNNGSQFYNIRPYVEAT